MLWRYLPYYSCSSFLVEKLTHTRPSRNSTQTLWLHPLATVPGARYEDQVGSDQAYSLSQKSEIEVWKLARAYCEVEIWRFWTYHPPPFPTAINWGSHEVGLDFLSSSQLSKELITTHLTVLKEENMAPLIIHQVWVETWLACFPISLSCLLFTGPTLPSI